MSIIPLLRSILSEIFDMIVPPRASEEAVRALAPEALIDMQTDDGLPYQDPLIRALMWELKYYANPHALSLCGALLADELLALAAESIGTPLLIPVPMHEARRRTRGHNQTELLCEAALKIISGEDAQLQYAPQALKRITDTPTQQGLERSKRLNNVAKSMLADERAVRGRTCIVVDDIATTGATLAEATRALKAAGAASVYTVAVAHS